MKKTDKNVIIFIIIAIVGVIIWTATEYRGALKERDEKIAQKESEDNTDKDTAPKTEDTQHHSDPIIPVMTAQELRQKMYAQTEELSIIDTRAQSAYDAGHIVGSVSVENMDRGTLGRTVVLVTQTGNEDTIMHLYRELADAKTVHNLAGGITQWQKDGHNLFSAQVVENFENRSKVRLVEPRDVHAMITQQNTQKKYLIIDTRRKGNYDNGHVQNAINIPLHQLEQRYREIPMGHDLYIYGADADTSFVAGVYLYNLRFMNVKTINGGFAAWKEYGYPIVQDAS